MAVEADTFDVACCRVVSHVATVDGQHVDFTEAPAIAGYREHEGQFYDATWGPIVDRDDWERVRTLLTAPERQQRGWHNGNARRYALSGLVFGAGTMKDGSVCGHVMVSMTASRLRGPSFICSRLAKGGCDQMRIAMEHLERCIVAQGLHANGLA